MGARYCANHGQEVHMKKVFAALFLAPAATILTTPAQAALCVSERDIQDTKPSNDGKLLTLKMRDGRVLVNHLQGICRDMRYTGFSWVLHGGNNICENQTVIQVLQSGQTCILGRFEEAKTTVPPKAQ
jgi:hypothetical protein